MQEKDKFRELLAARELADREPDSAHTPVSVLFSDIQGSTAYFETFGDVEGVAMIQRHNNLLVPVIEEFGGHVVKTIGDAIMARFADPASAINGAVEMQRALELDRGGRPVEEQIHIRIGVHSGLGVIRDNDVYGDIVNVASRVQQQAEPDQILITADMIEAAKTLGIQFARMGREYVRGKVEPIETYALAWSISSNEQLIEEIQARFDRRLKEAKRKHDALEQELESARDQWRGERRRFTMEIDRLVEVAERAKESARTELSNELQSEIRFHLEEAVRGRQLAEQDLVAAQARWETEREQLRSKIDTLQTSAIESMEQSNNPTRIAVAVREKLEARLKSARQDWELEWEGERRRLQAEIERLKKASGLASDPKKEAAKRALLEMLGKLPAGAAKPEGKSSADWEKEFSDAKIQWETECDRLRVRAGKAERELQQTVADIRSELLEELHAQFDPQLAVATRERDRLSLELETLIAQITDERNRNAVRMELLEQAVPAAQDAAKRQMAAELQAEYDLKFEELNRLKTRSERRYQDDSEEWEAERRLNRRQIAKLEEDLRSAREAAQKSERNKSA